MITLYHLTLFNNSLSNKLRAVVLTHRLTHSWYTLISYAIFNVQPEIELW